MISSGRTAAGMKPGEKGRILRFEDTTLAGKMMSMGVLPASTLEVTERTGFGQTVICRINHRFKIALRRDEAATIVMDFA